MSRVAELQARIAADQEALAEAIKEERSAALKRIKEEIKTYGFKTTDFKGVLLTRKKRGVGTAAKKMAAKRSPK